MYKTFFINLFVLHFCWNKENQIIWQRRNRFCFCFCDLFLFLFFFLCFSCLGFLFLLFCNYKHILSLFCYLKIFGSLCKTWIEFEGCVRFRKYFTRVVYVEDPRWFRIHKVRHCSLLLSVINKNYCLILWLTYGRLFFLTLCSSSV